MTAPLSTATGTSALPGVPAPTDRPLTAADRCDRCCAQAKVRVHLRAGELLFCGHHSARFAGPIAAALVAAQSTSGDPDR